MTVATILSGVRTAIAVTLVPASIVGGVCAALWAMNSGIDPVMVIFPISLASLVLVIVMERILPYRREWNHSHGDLRTDALYYLTQFVVGGLLAPVLGALTIIIGGAPCNEEVRQNVGADHFANDASKGVRICDEVYGE